MRVCHCRPISTKLRRLSRNSAEHPERPGVKTVKHYRKMYKNFSNMSFFLDGKKKAVKLVLNGEIAQNFKNYEEMEIFTPLSRKTLYFLCIIPYHTQMPAIYSYYTIQRDRESNT